MPRQVNLNLSTFCGSLCCCSVVLLGLVYDLRELDYPVVVLVGVEEEEDEEVEERFGLREKEKA